MARHMVMVRKLGPTRLLIRANISSVRSMVMEPLHGVIEEEKGNKKMICPIFVNVMLVNFKMINFMVRENMNGLINEFMMVIGWKEKWKDRESLRGLIRENILEVMFKIIKPERVF